MNDTGNDKGVTIRGTLPGSRAEKAGLRKGDRIFAINDVPVNTLEEVVEVLNKGAAQKVSLIRGNSFIELGLDMSVPPIDHTALDHDKLAGSL